MYRWCSAGVGFIPGFEDAADDRKVGEKMALKLCSNIRLRRQPGSSLTEPSLATTSRSSSSAAGYVCTLGKALQKGCVPGCCHLDGLSACATLYRNLGTY
jgi:hypothetical protein